MTFRQPYDTASPTRNDGAPPGPVGPPGPDGPDGGGGKPPWAYAPYEGGPVGGCGPPGGFAGG
ncbi:hypothetical protein GCM10009809_36660 [Isoptericola hypogeus]|uniref:Uncharacterized protein n=1 Tax=Isoptericola hypogeus TaxID=300179 RepID=A0ABP4VX29_9MICO